MRVLGINSVIGAVFGAVFVIVNAGSLNIPVLVALRVIAVIALVVVIVRGRTLRQVSDDGSEGRAATYGTAYRLVVAAELVAVVAGVPTVRALVGNDAIVGWIALVVGVHFFGLAAIWHRRRFAVLAVVVVVAGCGLAGLALAAGSARAAIVATVSGVVPGAVLLAFALQAVLSTPRAAAPPAGGPGRRMTR